MSVDKFGRYAEGIGKKGEPVKGPPGEGFKLTAGGDYNMDNKRLCNVYGPIDNQDAVNYVTFTEGMQKCITLQNKEFDAQGRRLCNLAEPVETDDAVSLRHLKTRVPIRFDLENTYSFHKYRVQDVADPVSKGDAVNLGYVTTNTMTKGAGGAFDAKNKVISNVSNPVKANDAVNKVYVDSKIPPLSGGTVYDFKNKGIRHIASPVQDSDAVPLKYLKTNTLMASVKDTTKWDSKNMPITNLPKPNNLDDAVSKRYLKETLGDLAYVVYKHLNQERREALRPEKEWRSRALDVNWDDLFKHK